jgi:hypothetical protein
MKYQDCVETAQAFDEAPGGVTRGEYAACDANINPVTGLATDYLNRFNEAIMLLEMLSSSPDCLDDFLAWQPASYREHFAASRFKGRAMAIAAYEAADPDLRGSLDALASTMTAMLEATRAALLSNMPPEAGGLIAEAAASWLKPLIARAGAVINGEADTRASAQAAPQAVVDRLMKRASA